MDGLNNMQSTACAHVDGPLLILAGAGSGKTRVITHRIAYLMEHEGINPYHILAITFTNKAANEMRERVNRIVGEGAEQVWVSTFHSLCVRILMRFADRLGYGKNFTIYDTADQKNAIKNILKELQIDPKQYPEKMFMAEISRAKEQYLSPDEFERRYAADYVKMKAAEVYRAYVKRLKTCNAFDFDDLIYKTVELFEHYPDILEYYQDRFRYIMVDEYQDTNHIQFLLVKMLAKKYRNLCVVGDDDQSIYKFRGANITNILNFEKEYPDAMVVKLEQNYRSCGNILEAANAVICHNAGRKDKKLWTEKEKGEKVSYTLSESEYEEAEQIASEIAKLVRQEAEYREIAVLYRTHAQSRVLEEKLVSWNIPYKIYSGTNFYDRLEIKDVMAYMKLLYNPEDNAALRRIINVPKRGIGDASIDKIAAFANQQEISMLAALRRPENIPGLGRTAAKISDFMQLLDSFRKILKEGESISFLYDRILEDTGYEEELIKEHSDESMTRLENLDEFRNRIIQFEEERENGNLGEFLQEIELVSEADAINTEDGVVSLMTLHSAKGLEFPYVFICGMEDRIFPSAQALNSEDEDALEEERRLCYVGITRAMKKLYLSSAKCRMMHGSHNLNPVSRFVTEIPPMLLSDAGELGRMKKRQQESMPFATSQSYGLKGGGYGQNNPYKKHASYGITPSTKPAFGKEFVVNREINPEYGEGDRVRHIKFGDGTVTQLVQGGRDYEVTVNFDRCGVKKMFASFAKLKKI